jgi:hypothetical protein
MKDRKICKNSHRYMLPACCEDRRIKRSRV